MADPRDTPAGWSVLKAAASRYRAAEWAIRMTHGEPVATDAHNARIDEWRAADAALASLLGERSPFDGSIVDIMAEHRLCGSPKYDGCYAHFPTMPHCRADGMAWPCDVERIRVLRGAL